jgi:predicted XRE-type DNA-binding protein
MKAAKKKPAIGSSLDEFLEDEGLREEFEALAIKEVIAWQIQKAMDERNISKARMAQLMNTSRAQIDRLLDPSSGNVTLETLARAAHVVGRHLRLELI